MPYTFGVGVDITQIDRIVQLINRSEYHYNRFLTGTYHSHEIEQFNDKKDSLSVQHQFLASRWALKEAMVKASGRPDLKFNHILLYKEKG